jgi:hypothetical protein
MREPKEAFKLRNGEFLRKWRKRKHKEAKYYIVLGNVRGQGTGGCKRRKGNKHSLTSTQEERH